MHISVPTPNLNEKRYLRALANAAGCAMLAAVILPLALIPVFNLGTPAGLSESAWSHILMIIAGLLMFVSATLIGRALLPQRERRFALHLGRPKNNPVATTMLGAAICLWGNMATAFVMLLGSQAGVDFQAPVFPGPQSVGTMLLALVSTAVIPGVMEELVFRGIIMQPLRMYGDRFAIVCSSVLFGLIHMNMQQAPMAFVAGLALGWAAIRCGGLWVPIIIHFWNNAAVVLLQFMQGRLSEAVYGQVQLGYFIGLSLLGGIGALVILFAGKRVRRVDPLQGIPTGQRTLRYFFGSIPMVLALIGFILGIWMMTTIG